MSTVYIDAQEMMDIAKITHGKLGMERANNAAEQCGGVGGENDVIHVKQQICNGGALVENKERGITFGGRKTEGGNKRGEAVKPCTRCLFKPIERFLQTANMRRVGGVKKARRLLTVDGLLKMTMKEGILDVQLMNGP
jgi:hypothetical protein